MQYTAIIKDGGLFIPNVFSDLNDGQAHVVQVTVDIDDVRQQLSLDTQPKTDAPRVPKKQVKKQTKKEVQKAVENADLGTLRKSALDELEALDDSELSEIFKAYMNDGQESSQISLENL
ncbi:hypothetical protein ACT3TH_00320 [Psychrobacter sp. AOP22-C1-C5]|uniref:hypothetical protein n=1 Tax=Psychrobacter sp. AOP22-C1-C5 TaxID=3457716 RepID=UPI0040372CF1